MLGLSNGRRGMKSPPLLVAGLLACVCVLGINYWITSTRCADMQHRVTQLEGRMRRAAAERGAVEIKKNEFEEKLEKQKEEIDQIHSLHNSQLRSARNEKVFLESNLTSKEKIIQALQAEMKTLQKDYEKLRGEMENFQESQAKKLNYELTQCSIKMKEMREQCEEQLKKTTGKSVDGPQPKETIVVEKIEILPVNEPKQEDPSAQKLEQSQTKTDVKEKGETSNKTEPKPPSDEVKIHINITDNQGVPGKQEANVKNPNDKVADYNGDGGNEAEPEAEKQAALVDHPDQKDSLNDKKTENEQMIEENKKKARDQML
ncbi:Golgi membrane protein 1 isoform X3 [Rhinatrema bivittatum]|uniref:Golgi membrane protein 1 isoform X3 n=1 Tax=Rhinatrema bivittatum TaxID=194408 RepID=UPI00112AFB13|nr:Golgi membrane protein 1 isoform X3 [Rhinatrema bivittatum]